MEHQQCKMFFQTDLFSDLEYSKVREVEEKRTETLLHEAC